MEGKQEEMSIIEQEHGKLDTLSGGHTQYLKLGLSNTINLE